MGLTKCLIICCLPPPGCFARCKAWAPPPRGWPRCRGAGEPTSEAPQSPPPEAAPPWGFPNPWSTLHHSAVAGFPHPLWEESGFPWHPTGHLGPRPLSFQPNSMMLQKKPHLSKQLSKLGQNAENCKYDQTGVGHIKNHQRATLGLRLQGFKGPLDGRGLKSLFGKNNSISGMISNLNEPNVLIFCQNHWFAFVFPDHNLLFATLSFTKLKMG